MHLQGKHIRKAKTTQKHLFSETFYYLSPPLPALCLDERRERKGSRMELLHNKWHFGGAPLGWRASDLYAKEPRSRLAHGQNARETLQNCYILLKKALCHSTKCKNSIVFRNFGDLYALLLAIYIYYQIHKITKT